MLVMSLVVLGIFSFRDLGVDLFPKADPATVTVTVQLPGASPDEMATAVVEPLEEALSSISGIDEMLAQRISEGSARSHPPLRARARHQRRRQRRPREGRRRDARPAAAGAAAGHPEGRSRLGSDHGDRPVVGHDEPADADRDRRQAGEARHRGGQRRRPGRPRRRPRARDPHRRRHREAERLRAHHRARPRARSPSENVEVPGGTVEQGKAEILLRTLGRVDAAEEFNHIIVATVNGTPIRVLGRRLRRGHHRAAAAGGVAGRRAGGDARRPARHRREHHRRRRRRQGQARAGAPDAAEGSHAHGHARRLEVHLRRRSPRSRSTCSGAASSPAWSSCSSSATCAP